MRQGPNGRRPRGRPNRNQHGGPSRPNSYDSSGPEGRIRGNAHQVYEKYVGLARDAVSSGDRVAAETYFQHAEHYFRIVNSSTDPESADRRPARQDGNGRDFNDRNAGRRGPQGQDARRSGTEDSGPAPGPAPAPARRDANSAAADGAPESGQPDRPAESTQSAQAEPAAPAKGPDDREGLDRVIGKEAAAPRRRGPRRAPRPDRSGNGQDQPSAPSEEAAKPRDTVEAGAPVDPVDPAGKNPDSEPAA